MKQGKNHPDRDDDDTLKKSLLLLLFFKKNPAQNTSHRNLEDRSRIVFTKQKAKKAKAASYQMLLANSSRLLLPSSH